MEVFGWNKNPTNHDLAYYYPTQTLVTAPEIIFFWVARMIMAGYEFTGQKPFNEVYFTGIVRDKKGKKMSKSLGNSPDLLELIDEFGADAARFSVMFSSPAGNDLLFDKEAIVQGRNFCNKMWNALRLIKGWESRTTTAIDDDSPAFAIMWMREKVNATATEISVLMKDFKLSEALKVLYGLIWNDFCSWYLEWVKPAQDAPVSQEVYSETVSLYQYLLQLLHPFMPFITEDIYSKLDSRTAGDHLMVRQLPALTPVNNSVLTKGEKLQAIITGLRDGRNKNNLKPKYIIDIKVDSPQADFYKEMQALIEKQVNGTISGYGATNGDKGITVVVGADQLYITAEALQTTAPAQKDQLKKDLDYLKGFLESVERKLSNEKFINNAKPEVIALEQNKKTDALEKIAVLELALASLN